MNGVKMNNWRIVQPAERTLQPACSARDTSALYPRLYPFPSFFIPFQTSPFNSRETIFIFRVEQIIFIYERISGVGKLFGNWWAAYLEAVNYSIRTWIRRCVHASKRKFEGVMPNNPYEILVSRMKIIEGKFDESHSTKWLEIELDLSF